MKWTKEEGKKLYELIIAENGKPETEKLIDLLGTEKGQETSRMFYIGKFAVYTDAQIVTMAKKALEKIGE